MTCRWATPSDDPAIRALCAGRPAAAKDRSSLPRPSGIASAFRDAVEAGGRASRPSSGMASTGRETAWAVAEEDGAIVAAALVSVEPATRLGKLQSLRADGPAERRPPRLRDLAGFLTRHFQEAGTVDLLYGTTRNLSMEEQSATVAAGFKVLGVFPGAVAADPTATTGLAAWYAPGVLADKRHADFALHPAIAPFYDIAASQCGLASLPPAAQPLGPAAFPQPEAPAPSRALLEVIDAPAFAAERFRRLKERRSLSVNFYPFTDPNVILMSADESIQVFASLSREVRFATIIGEHLRAGTDPVQLYSEALRLLHGHGALYIEVINDAADAAGIEYILRAGFSPCGYVPCLKLLGDKRRDFVVFANSKETAVQPGRDHPEHRRFFEEYVKISLGGWPPKRP